MRLCVALTYIPAGIHLHRRLAWVGLSEHRVRLAICVLLSRHDAFSFTRLKELLRETGRGNWTGTWTD
jgi:hypothetical protein